MGQTLPVRHTGGAISLEQVRELERKSRRENLGRAWYKFSRNSLSLVGGGMVLLVFFLAIFAPLIAPYPEHVKPFTDFANAKSPPSWAHPCLLYTSDAADDPPCVDLGGTRLIKKKTLS